MKEQGIEKQKQKQKRPVGTSRGFFSLSLVFVRSLFWMDTP